MRREERGGAEGATRIEGTLDTRGHGGRELSSAGEERHLDEGILFIDDLRGELPAFSYLSWTDAPKSMFARMHAEGSGKDFAPMRCEPFLRCGATFLPLRRGGGLV